MVEPLPLVPATWITGGRCCCGSPSAASSRRTRSSERSISLGWNSSSRRRTSSTPPRAPSLVGGVSSVAANPAPERHHLRRRFRSAQEADEAHECIAQIAALHHQIDHAVLEQVFRALEAL